MRQRFPAAILGGVLLLPAVTARALLSAFRVLGLDADAIRDAAAIRPEELEPLDALLPDVAFTRLYEEAFRRAPREELPTEIGLAVPFGTFGHVDYLAASSETVEAAMHALAAHFRSVAHGLVLELQEVGAGGEVRLIHPGAPGPLPAVGDEFTLAVLVGRFRAADAEAPFRAAEVRLSRPAPPRPTRHAALLGAPVRFGCSVSALTVPPAAWRARLRSADPALTEVLRRLAERLELGPSGAGDLELAVRARLRALLPEGGADARTVARALGMSERTLHRRLHEAGGSFRTVVDRFREAESERLLAAGRLALAEVALRVGFSDQTAWNRAFRRWKGMAPTDWVAARR
jgi:AraC-like DNA-binding protein